MRMVVVQKREDNSGHIERYMVDGIPLRRTATAVLMAPTSNLSEAATVS